MKTRFLTAAVLPLCAALLLTGCGDNKPKPPAKGDNKPIIPEPGGQPTAAAHVQRGKQLQRNKNDMQQLATFYIQYELENNRSPANWQDLKAYIGNSAPNLVRMVDAGEVAIVPSVKPTSSTVLVYETKPDLNGKQFAAFGDKHVDGLTPEQLQQALQNH